MRNVGESGIAPRVSPCNAWWRRSGDAAGCISTASLLYTSLPTLYFILHPSYHHALHGGDAVRCSRLHLHCVSTLYFTSYFILPTSSFVSPCIAWWRRSTMQQAASPLRLYFILHHHAMHGGDAVEMQQAASPLRLYFILHFLLYTSYFILHYSPIGNARVTLLCDSRPGSRLYRKGAIHVTPTDCRHLVRQSR